jgi:hypothetical protein
LSNIKLDGSKSLGLFSECSGGDFCFYCPKTITEGSTTYSDKGIILTDGNYGNYSNKCSDYKIYNLFEVSGAGKLDLTDVEFYNIRA